MKLLEKMKLKTSEYCFHRTHKLTLHTCNYCKSKFNWTGPLSFSSNLFSYTTHALNFSFFRFFPYSQSTHSSDSEGDGSISESDSSFVGEIGGTSENRRSTRNRSVPQMMKRNLLIGV